MERGSQSPSPMSLLARRAFPIALAACAGFGATLVDARTAEACGGCFAPPIANTVVSYHRMVLSVSTKETTLYDQIRYSGSPESFAWVLPIRGVVDVGLSADLMFAAIDQQTQSSIIPPPTNCPLPPSCPSDSYERGAPTASMGSADAGASVNVLKEETIGPYETVQLQSTNANALKEWLESRGYAIPDDIQPLIATYVQEGFDFLALKLVPGQGVDTMKPVRITTQGAAPSLPLRMIAAGSGANVGVTLWVVAEGRWEPQTFPSFYIGGSDLTWTWKEYRSDLDKLRKNKLDELGGAAWEIESSIDVGTQAITSLLDRQRNFGAITVLPDGGYGRPEIYDPVLDKDGKVVKTSDQVEQEDYEKLFQGRWFSRITRMRSELPRASLATDLGLQASSVQLPLNNFKQVTKEADEPTCAVYEGCKYAGTAPRSEAQAAAKSDCGTANAFCDDSSGCAVKRVGLGTTEQWGFAVFGLVVAGLRGLRRAAKRERG